MFPLAAILGIGEKLIDKFFPDPEQKAKAQLELMQMQQNGELAQIQADIAGQQEVTKRWEADMASDSWLSKNIRPMTLIFILCAYFIFSMMSAFGIETRGAYVELLGQWGIVVMTAYFAKRSVEKVMDTKAKDGK
jgi:uncharacterized membrane protein (DUF106 family)